MQLSQHFFFFSFSRGQRLKYSWDWLKDTPGANPHPSWFKVPILETTLLNGWLSPVHDTPTSPVCGTPETISTFKRGAGLISSPLGNAHLPKGGLQLSAIRPAKAPAERSGRPERSGVPTERHRASRQPRPPASARRTASPAPRPAGVRPYLSPATTSARLPLSRSAAAGPLGAARRVAAGSDWLPGRERGLGRRVPAYAAPRGEEEGENYQFRSGQRGGHATWSALVKPFVTAWGFFSWWWVHSGPFLV